MKLFLDDVRDCPEGWVACRNAEDAIAFLRMGDFYVEEISFDHDLGSALTGNSVAQEIERQVVYCGRTHIPKWRIHSSNPVGRKNIERTMLAAERICSRQLVLGVKTDA